MAEQKQIKTREDLINDVRICGQSIINNAENIVGDERYFLKGIIQFIIQRNDNSIPTIQISREFVPEQYIENIGKEKPKKSPEKKTTKTNKKGDTKNVK